MGAPYTSYNRYFLLPFCIWLCAGGLALCFFDKQMLFAAVNTHHSSVLDVLMYYISMLGEGPFSAILLLLLLGMRQLRNWWYFIAAACCNILSALLTQGVKFMVNAPRPLNYFHDAAWVHITPEWPRLYAHSFPSGHTCAGFALFSFLAFLLPPPYRGWGLFLFIVALLIGYSRIYLAAHFFLDVYVGSILGTFFTMMLLAIMRYTAHHFFKGKKPGTATSDK